MTSAPTALVCDVQRFSVHDGPGVRTTVFFKGCPLACRWCQNPETIAFGNERMYTALDCIGCGDCVRACPHGALRLVAGGPVFDSAECRACLSCTRACPSGALAPAARAVAPGDLLAEVLRDADYYPPDGGLTLSGGEPLSQIDFLAAFLPLSRAAGLHVVAQTAGHWEFEAVRPILGLIDLFLFDLKVLDDAAHRALCGRSNRRILANLDALVAEGRSVEVRMPVVPGCNDDPGNLASTAELIRRCGLDGITLLPYHPLGEAKRSKLAGAGASFCVDGDGRLAAEAAAIVLRAAGLTVRSAEPT